MRNDSRSPGGDSFTVDPFPVGDRRENGSAFYWPGPEILDASAPGGAADAWPGAIFVGYGRDALRLAVAGTRRLWAPSYFCEDVLEALVLDGLELRRYPDQPAEAYCPFLGPVPGDSVLVCNTFGLRAQPPVLGFDRAGIVLVEDHSHDPWSQWVRGSDADACIASLRKTLPLADGGVLWSPRGKKFGPPAPLSRSRSDTSCRHAAAMILKRLFLAGDRSIDGEFYRQMSLAADRVAGEGPAAAMTPWSQGVLSRFPVREWREKRRANANRMAARLAGISELRMLMPHEAAADSPFMAVLVFPDASWVAPVRGELVAERIYPAVLWAETGTPGRDNISGRMLCVHIDGRYGTEDMDWIADRIVRAVKTTGRNLLRRSNRREPVEGT